MEIQITDLSMRYGKNEVIHNVNLHIQEGELVALLGPSGSGKTSLLRLIGGLEVPSSGNIRIGSRDVTTSGIQDRDVGFVFQHYALFKHMNIFNNVAFGLKVRPRKIRPSKQQIYDKVMELLQMVQLESYARRYPSQLSGGQRQRVALARALAVEPQILLLDEPFGALDAKVRQDLRRWLRRLHERLNITTIFVTHDQEEALELADKVVVMNQGKIEQIGTPEEVYNDPINEFVFTFLGRVNLFHRRFQSDNSLAAVQYIRPHDVILYPKPQSHHDIEVRTKHITQVGSQYRIEVESAKGNDCFEVEMSIQQFKETNIGIGEIAYANLQKAKVFQK